MSVTKTLAERTLAMLNRNAETHDNAAYLAFSDVGGSSDQKRADALWARRDEYAFAAKCVAQQIASEDV